MRKDGKNAHRQYLNKSNRLKADDMHTLGPNSYALLRHELQQEDPNKEPLSQAKVYIKSRIRNPKRKYKTSYQKPKQNMEKMEALSAQQHEGATYQDSYYKVIKKSEHSGRLRLYGTSVTKSTMKRGNNSNFMLPKQFLQCMERDWVERIQ
ncbi:Proline iminopeptidase [Bienertia sinuspersici]